jgi:hypothetical protein
LRRARRRTHPRNGLADQLFDRRDAFRLGRGNDSDGGARPSRAAGAADAMDVIVGMMRDVEVEDVAHRWNVEPARRDIGSHQQSHFVPAELIERGGARRLIHVAVQRNGGKTVTHQ